MQSNYDVHPLCECYTASSGEEIDNLRVAIYSKGLLRFPRRKNNDKIALSMQWSVVF